MNSEELMALRCAQKMQHEERLKADRIENVCLWVLCIACAVASVYCLFVAAT